MNEKVSFADLMIGYKLANSLTGAFVGGSAILNRQKANDVDVVVSESNWDANGPLLVEYGLIHYTPDDPHQEYAQDVLHNEIVALYRGNNNINLIVVSDLFYPAYKAGELEYHRNPHLYAENKAERESLHKDMKAVIRSMLDGSWQETRRVPVAIPGPHGVPVHWGFTV